jgi:hypothetical protein
MAYKYDINRLLLHSYVFIFVQFVHIKRYQLRQISYIIHLRYQVHLYFPSNLAILMGVFTEVIRLLNKIISFPFKTLALIIIE